MSSSTPKADLSLFETVDVRAFLETLRIRWWIIPVVVAVSVGFLQAQESDLRTEPTTFAVSRSYEVGFPQQVLSSVGIRNDSVREFPDLATQILILQSNETRDEISSKLAMDVEVQVPENFETPFTLSCNLPSVTDCEKAIGAYLEKATEIREGAVRAGLENLKVLLIGLQETNPDPLLPPQIAALETLSETLEVKFALVDGFEQAIGPTINQVQRPTYLMGAIAGLVISFLILLQLTYTDSRIRSVRQLVRIVGDEDFLGRFTSKQHEVRDRRTAVALRQGLRASSASRLRYLPLRQSLDNETVLNRLAVMTGVPHDTSKPFAELSVPELSASVSGQADVLVVKRNRDLRKDLIEALAALHRSDRRLSGVLLID